MKKIFVSPHSFALVDDEDYKRVNKYKWYLSKGYAVSGGSKKCGLKNFTKMHRFILHAKAGEIIDHRDRDKLNNSKENIFISNKYENIHNQKKRANTKNSYKGTQFIKKLTAWQSRCRMFGEDCFLGYYKTEIAAAYAFNKKAISISKYACINQLPYSEKELEIILKRDRLLGKSAARQSKFKYIYWKKQSGRMKSGKWYTLFRLNGAIKTNGYFDTENECLTFLKNNYSTTLKDIGDIKRNKKNSIKNGF